MIPFNLRGEYIELNKLLKVTSLCPSGGAANQAITQGLVKVDGKPEIRKSCKIRVGQQVEFEGNTVLIEKESS
jgi:ribosome-associated protein